MKRFQTSTIAGVNGSHINSHIHTLTKTNRRFTMKGLLTSTLAGLALTFVGSILVASPVLADNGQVVATKAKVINGEKYTFNKYLDEDGETSSTVVNSTGRVISEKAVPRGKRSLVGKRLQSKMESVGDTGRIKVNIALDLAEDVSDETPEIGEVEVLQGNTVSIAVNGIGISEAALEDRVKKQAREHREKGLAAMKAREAKLLGWSKRHGLESRAAIQHALKEGRNTVTIELTKAELKALIQANGKMMRGIELYQPPHDQITQAMADTSISTSALPYSSTRGSGIGIYMTESGCANEFRFTNYDRLSGSETDHSRNVGGILRAVSPESFIYCRGSAVLPTFTDLHGRWSYRWPFSWTYTPPLNPPIYVANRSNGANNGTGYSTGDRDWDNFVYNENIPAFIAAGNEGNGNGNVIFPAKGLNVIAVGNYNDANDTINSSSSYVDPQTGNDKPEVTAPGTSITAGGFTKTGTSMAAPHAAAFSADMMSRSTYLKYKPYLVKATLLAGATDAIIGGSDKVGLGGIDFASAQWSGYYQWYTGNNSAFDYYAKYDGGSSSYYIEKRIYISSYWAKARAVISWLNRGSYTYDHRNDAHPIGMDLDLRVYDPYGRYVGGSFSWDNPYEKVNFTPTVSGYYTFKINRYANRDTSLNLRMGLYVNYYKR